MQTTPCPKCSVTIHYLKELVLARSFHKGDIQCVSCNTWVTVPEELEAIVKEEAYKWRKEINLLAGVLDPEDGKGLRVLLNRAFMNRGHFRIPKYDLFLTGGEVTFVFQGYGKEEE